MKVDWEHEILTNEELKDEGIERQLVGQADVCTSKYKADRTRVMLEDVDRVGRLAEDPAERNRLILRVAKHLKRPLDEIEWFIREPGNVARPLQVERHVKEIGTAASTDLSRDEQEKAARHLGRHFVDDATSVVKKLDFDGKLTLARIFEHHFLPEAPPPAKEVARPDPVENRTHQQALEFNLAEHEFPEFER